MKTTIAGFSIAALLTIAPAFGQTVGQDFRNAGSNIKNAAKNTGRATVKTGRTVTNATKRAVHKGSSKVANKTGR